MNKQRVRGSVGKNPFKIFKEQKERSHTNGSNIECSAIHSYSCRFGSD